MATMNQVQKTSYEAIRIDYTSKDYTNILNDLIESIPGITQKWNSTDVSDPGMILVKLMAIVGDMLFYNQDMQSLEIYPNSVTQRKNASTIYKLIGYKMKWYRSAILEANVVNTYSNGATMPRFCTFTTDNDEITYTTFEQYELPSNTSNNGLETTIELIQGIPVTPVRTSTNPYPDAGKPWHSIYGYNFSTENLINNRLYLDDQNIDQDHIILIDDQNETWTLQENIYLTREVGRLFEFGVDVNDQPYLELIDYWPNFNVSKFKVFYIKSMGEDGQIYSNTLKNLTGNVWSRETVDQNQVVYNVSSFIHFTNYDSTFGYNPETADEARKNSVAYLNTLDTIITLADFERACLREPGVANVRCTDLTNDPGIQVSYLVGNINMDTVDNINEEGQVITGELIDDKDLTLLENYLADPDNNPLTSYQQKLADCNQDGQVNGEDLACLRNYLHPKAWAIGDINQDEVINETDLNLLKQYIANPDVEKDNFTDFQIRLMDINKDGLVNNEDVTLLENHISEPNPIENEFGTLIDTQSSGYVGISSVSDTQLLDSFVVKLYILRDEQYETVDDDTYTSMIQTDLASYKILPLSIIVDLHSIQKYYWTVTGTFFTKEPLSRDDLQNIIITINNNLRYQYSVDKINFNTVINYKEVIETILAVDNRILMVDLDPITYRDSEDNEISKEQLTGNYTHTVAQLKNPVAADNLHYDITLPQTPILPGSVMIRIDNGQYVLRDNNNGSIYNVDNVLSKKGSIDYVTGQISLDFSDELSSDIIINYTRNKTNIAVYRNLSTQSFYFDPSSLQADDVQNLV